MNIFGVWLSFSSCFTEVILVSISCGIDSSPVPSFREGITRLEYYPWLGVLYYPHNEFKLTTAVVLVTRQIVLAAATEIDKLPKANFRALARVTIGCNCTGPAIAIRDYAYHPDYTRGRFSTLAIIQLETDFVKRVLRPICPPPTYIKDQSFFAMVLSDSCKQSQVRIYEMKYVPPDQCYRFYRWTGLGIGIYGPGCQAPARFLDYGMHHDWVRRSILRIGRTSISALEDNHIILRKTTANVQRFGACDSEEMDDVYYTESTIIDAFDRVVTMSHNLTLFSDVEYSCVIVTADNNKELGIRERYAKPIVSVRRWCAKGTELCYGFAILDVDLMIDIKFRHSINLKITAYGKQAAYIDPEKSFAYVNSFIGRPTIRSYAETKQDFQGRLNSRWYPSYGFGGGPF